MNENIDLTKILKDCPKGWKFYSSVYGDVYFVEILTNNPSPRHLQENALFFIKILMLENPVRLKTDFIEFGVSSAGEHKKGVGECTLFPSREQRDWSKFSAPWYKKDKFDPKTLQPFDKVICRIGIEVWRCDLFSSYVETYTCPNVCVGNSYIRCIPYNDDTKHLVGTTDEAPEYYRYWEE